MSEVEEGIIEAEAIEEMEQLPAVQASNALVARGEMSVAELIAQADKIKAVMSAAMKENVHYGKIPGISKPTLLKPGAEMLNVLLRLAPSYDSERVFHDDGHLTVISKCTLTHIPTNYVIAEGEGLCSTKEVKYRYRTGGRICPECGVDAIIKGKAEYGGGWICFGRKGGCGTKWADGTEQAKEFENMDTGRVENPDLADSWNTVLKMADKRALLAACLNGTAASDIFTQDAEDLTPAGASGTPPSAPPKAFDPETDLAEGAIKGENAAKEIGGQLNRFDPTVDWGAVLEEVVQEKYGEPSHRSLQGADLQDFWRRLSNSVWWIEQATKEGDFPPVPAETLVAGIAYGFSGIVVEVTYKEVPKAGDLLTPEQQEATKEAASEDVPFVDEEEARQ